jgi:hypothetical protein
MPLVNFRGKSTLDADWSEWDIAEVRRALIRLLQNVVGRLEDIPEDRKWCHTTKAQEIAKIKEILVKLIPKVQYFHMRFERPVDMIRALTHWAHSYVTDDEVKATLFRLGDLTPLVADDKVHEYWIGTVNWRNDPANEEVMDLESFISEQRDEWQKSLQRHFESFRDSLLAIKDCAEQLEALKLLEKYPDGEPDSENPVRVIRGEKGKQIKKAKGKQLKEAKGKQLKEAKSKQLKEAKGKQLKEAKVISDSENENESGEDPAPVKGNGKKAKGNGKKQLKVKEAKVVLPRNAGSDSGSDAVDAGSDINNE